MQVKLSKINQPLREDENKLLYKVFKERFNYYYNGWKNLLEFEQNENDMNLIPRKLIDNQISRFVYDIQVFCKETINTIEILESKLDKDDKNSKIFYLSFKGDYYKYMAEVSEEIEFLSIVELADDCYREAFEMCKLYLEPQNNLTLSVALNYSVFIYLITDDTKRAYGIADNVYRQAIQKIEQDKRSSETEILIKLIEENLTIWKIEIEEI